MQDKDKYLAFIQQQKEAEQQAKQAEQESELQSKEAVFTSENVIILVYEKR